MDNQMETDRQLSQYEIKKAPVNNNDSNEISTSSNSPKEADSQSRAVVQFGNKKPAHDMVIGDKFTKINQLESQDFFNMAQ